MVGSICRRLECLNNSQNVKYVFIMWPKSFTTRKMQSCTHSKAYMRSSINQTWYKPNSPAWVISQIYALSSMACLPPPIIKCTLNFCGLVWSHSLAAGYIKMILYLIRLGAKSPTVITLFLSRNQSHTYTRGNIVHSHQKVKMTQVRVKFSGQGKHTNSHLHFRPLLSRTARQ